MSKLADKLANLLRLATLKPGEERDEARVNEARTASFLLVKTCQDNGVKLSFKLPRQEQPAPPQGTHVVDQFDRATRDGQPIPFDDFIRFVYGEQKKRAAQESFKRPRAHQPPRPTSPFRANEVFQTTYAHSQRHPSGLCAACKVPLDEAEHVWMRRIDDRGRATHILCGTEALFAVKFTEHVDVDVQPGSEYRRRREQSYYRRDK